MASCHVGAGHTIWAPLWLHEVMKYSLTYGARCEACVLSVWLCEAAFKWGVCVGDSIDALQWNVRPQGHSSALLQVLTALSSSVRCPRAVGDYFGLVFRRKFPSGLNARLSRILWPFWRLCALHGSLRVKNSLSSGWESASPLSLGQQSHPSVRGPWVCELSQRSEGIYLPALPQRAKVSLRFPTRHPLAAGQGTTSRTGNDLAGQRCGPWPRTQSLAWRMRGISDSAWSAKTQASRWWPEATASQGCGVSTAGGHGERAGSLCSRPVGQVSGKVFSWSFLNLEFKNFKHEYAHLPPPSLLLFYFY